MDLKQYDIVVQTEVSEGKFECRGFSGVPAARRSWIAIVSSGSDEGRLSAAKLAEEMEAALLGSGPQVTVNDIDGALAPSATNHSDEADRLKLLVLVGHANHRFQDQDWYGNWESDQDQSGVMILLPAGKYEDFFVAGLPDEHLLHRVNTASWSDSIAEVLPSVFARADVTSNFSRVFISYRRVETLPLALQLFDRLIKEGFDVFLDRFSIPPGYDFQSRLTQELEDKSMVVLLESRHLKDSKWTQHEIDFAKRRQLGLLALQMPDVQDPLISINPDAREKLEPSDFARPPLEDDRAKVKQWQTLNDKVLDRVVARIKKAHADALFRRRHHLRKDLVAVLGADARVQISYTAVGPLNVVRGADNHVLWPTTRPPEVGDFRPIYGALRVHKDRSPGSCAIIVGPLAALEPNRQEQLKWLRDVSQCRAFDEGNLPELARQLGSGDWS
jgi:hypothetical protein